MSVRISNCTVQKCVKISQTISKHKLLLTATRQPILSGQLEPPYSTGAPAQPRPPYIGAGPYNTAVGDILNGCTCIALVHCSSAELGGAAGSVPNSVEAPPPALSGANAFSQETQKCPKCPK